MERLALLGGEPVCKEPIRREGKRFGEEEEKQLMDVLRSGKLNRNVGSKVTEFERAFADYLGVKFAVMSTSGTAAIHIALGSLMLEPGSEVITSPITDMGTIMPIFLTLCVPVFADIDEETWEVNPEDIEERITHRTKAIIPIHLFGNACDMKRIKEIAEDHNLHVIEDCAQAYGTTFNGEHVGKLGDLGCFSLNHYKHITCGDGGITVTDDEELAYLAKLFSDKAWPREKGRTSLFVAPNYRVTELQAAVALAQLRKVEKIVSKRAWLGRLLNSLIEDAPGVKVQKSYPHSRHTYYLYPFTVPSNCRDAFVKALRAEGVPASAGYIKRPVYTYEVFTLKRTFGKSEFPFGYPPFRPKPDPIKYRYGLCPKAERWLKEAVTISINEFWTKEDIEATGEAINKVSYWIIQKKIKIEQ